MAAACVFLMSLEDSVFNELLAPKDSGTDLPIINIGVGQDITRRVDAKAFIAVEEAHAIHRGWLKERDTPRGRNADN